MTFFGCVRVHAHHWVGWMCPHLHFATRAVYVVSGHSHGGKYFLLKPPRSDSCLTRGCSEETAEKWWNGIALSFELKLHGNFKNLLGQWYWSVNFRRESRSYFFLFIYFLDVLIETLELLLCVSIETADVFLGGVLHVRTVCIFLPLLHHCLMSHLLLLSSLSEGVKQTR